MGALDGIKVIDLSHVLAAPFATMIMADLGAEVINCLLYTSPSPRD